MISVSKDYLLNIDYYYYYCCCIKSLNSWNEYFPNVGYLKGILHPRADLNTAFPWELPPGLRVPRGITIKAK